jgi:nicotinamide-nucleotide amidase
VTARWTSAEVVAVGSELLTPFRLDTNSLFITDRLNGAGLDVGAKAVVADDRDEIARAIRDGLSRADLVVVTGGLGPTADDVTREAVAAALGRPLKEDAAALDHIVALFARRRLAMPAINRRQALVPDGATVLANTRGSAPGLWIDVGPRAVVLLPGPPREMQPMFDDAVMPRLGPRTGGQVVRRRAITVAGRSESAVDEITAPIYLAFLAQEPAIRTTILATPGLIELTLSTRGGDPARLDDRLSAAVAALRRVLEPAVVSDDGRTIEEVVGALLAARNWRIAVAESCTGGLVLGRLTNVAGCSAWVLGGIVAYDNVVKERALSVEPQVLAAHGAVSEPVACAMAEGVRARCGADVGLAITGIAGPGGGTPTKPVGTVVIAVAAGERPAEARTLALVGDRAAIRQHAVIAALDAVRRSLER